MNRRQIVGFLGLLFIVVGGTFIYATVDAIQSGFVMDGGRYNKTKYTRVGNPKEFKSITDSMMMLGVVFVLAGGAMSLICFGGNGKSANQSPK